MAPSTGRTLGGRPDSWQSTEDSLSFAPKGRSWWTLFRKIEDELDGGLSSGSRPWPVSRRLWHPPPRIRASALGPLLSNANPEIPLNAARQTIRGSGPPSINILSNRPLENFIKPDPRA